MKIFYTLFFIFYIFVLPGKSFADERKLLSNEYSLNDVQNILLGVDEWHPYPKYGENNGWDRFPEDLRKTHISLGEQQLGKPWTFLPATVFLEFQRTGNRSNYESLASSRRGQLSKLVLAEIFEQKQRFIDDIVNGVWAICEETYWGLPAHLSLQKAGFGLPDVIEPTVDLVAAETANLLAWTYYFLGEELDKVSPLVSQRIEYEIDRRILTPNFTRDDFWWMGFEGNHINNWNPWVNSNWLTCVLLIEKDKDRRDRAVYKIMKSLDKFIGIYPQDGGCDEGPAYWPRAGGSLFDCLDLLASASNNKINIFDDPLIKNIAAFIYRAYINKSYFINFADAPPRVSVEPAHIYRFGKSINDSTMMRFAGFCANYQSNGKGYSPRSYGRLNRHLPALFVTQEVNAIQPREPNIKDFWLSDIQVMGARSKDNSNKGFYLAAKGGHNAESHNHNDVGNFIVYYDGEPLLIDAGSAVYTKTTFSDQRYTLWFTQSGYHNLPLLNGVMQKNGREFAVANARYHADDDKAWFFADIAGAYPDSAQIKKWERKIILVRDKQIRLEEEYEFQQVLQPIVLNFMTANKPFVSETDKGKISIAAKDNQNSGKGFTLHYDHKKFDVNIEPKKLTDSRMRNSWGETLYSIRLVAKDKNTKGKHIITITH